VAIPAHPDLAPPVKARAETFAVAEKYGVIWVCFGEPAGDVPALPTGDEAGFRILLAGPYRFRALGPRLIENFLDVGHLGIVHAGLLGEPERARIEDYEVSPGTAEGGPEARRIRVWQPNPDGTGSGAEVFYDYRVLGPLTAGFVKLPVEGGEGRFGILAQVTPVDGEFSEMRMIMTMNYGHEIPDAELTGFQDLVAGQDKAIVESQRPELLPLDLQSELHLRSDRLAIAYRKWLTQVGFTYGVA
jgi:phenylpropionate dioxygenase-like ring-hydroxylating dioxygenase large terminal subunit